MPTRKTWASSSPREIAEDFLARTGDLYKRARIAGSIRRKEPIVHDIDIAVIPKGKDYSGLEGEGDPEREGDRRQVVTFGEVISDFMYRGVQVNLFLCPDKDAWGVTQMWATGPKGHTIGMTIKARNKGLIINSKGLWTREEPHRLITARTEQEVGRLLDWKYKPPEERGKTAEEGTRLLLIAQSRLR